MEIPNGSITAQNYYGTEVKSANQKPIRLRFGNWSQSRHWTKPDKPVKNAKDPNGYRRPSNWSGADSGLIATGQLRSFEGIMPTNPAYICQYGGTVAARIVEQAVTPLSPNNVRMKVLNNIRDEVFDVAMVLAEMQGTVNTLSSNLLRVGRSLQAVKNRKPVHFDYLMHGRRPPNLRGRRADKFNREVAGTYLEWKYGIMPTIYDIQGACKGLDMNEKGSLFDNPPLLVARSSDQDTETVNWPTWANAYASTFRGFTSVRVTRAIKARCDFRVDGDGLRGLNRYGLGLGTVATVLYDKTPFSFVLNMAFPLAELIKAWTALAGVNVIGYCETSYIKKQPIKGSVSGVIYGVDEVAKLENFNTGIAFNRVAYYSVPFPVPFVRNPIKTGNVATVLSLFTQLRKPRKTKLDSFHF